MNTVLMMSWTQVCADLPGFSRLFYGKLFIIHPPLRQRLRIIEVAAQDRLLQTVLGAIATGRMPTRRLLALGRRLAGHDFQPTDYAVIAYTLLWALEQLLGTSWTPAVRTAWDDTLMRSATLLAVGERRRRGTPVGANLIPFPFNRLHAILSKY